MPEKANYFRLMTTLNLTPDQTAVLTAISEQMDRQVAAKYWHSCRIPTDLVPVPAGMSQSKMRRTLTELRKQGLVNTRNGLWWALPAGRVAVGFSEWYSTR